MKKVFLRVIVLVLTAVFFTAGMVPGAGSVRVFADNEKEAAEKLRSVYAARSGEDTGKAVDFAVREDLEKAGSATYTLMIYVIGSDLEGKMGKATRDIEEMLASGVDLQRSNILLCTGGSTQWKANISAQHTSILDLSRPDSDWVVAASAGNTDMGREETLSAFVNFCTEYYPATHYGLVFWDHGGGPLWGYGCDEFFDADSLLLSEMRAAMDKTVFGAGRARLDWVGFDACLMGSVECMYLWSSYADYMVSSEEMEPGDGWDYSFLSILNETEDAVDITGAVVERFGEAGYDADSTLSCVDLGKVKEGLPDLYDALGVLSGDISGGAFLEVAKLREDARSFGKVADSEKGTACYDLVDLKDLAGNMEERYPEEAQGIQDFVEKAVVHNYDSLSVAGGISMYWPAENKALLREMKEKFSALGMDEPYVRFLDSIGSAWLYSPQNDWYLGSVEMTEDGGILRLTQEQLSGMKEVYYTVFRELMSENGTYYYPRIMHVRLEADDEGVIHIPADPMLVCVGDEDNYYDWSAVQTDTSKVQDTYRTWRTGLLRNEIGSDIYTWAYDHAGHEMAEFTFTWREEDGVRIKTLTDAGGGFRNTRKNELHLGDWEGMVDIHPRALHPLRDLQGRMLPWEEWYDIGNAYFQFVSLGDTFGFHMVPASECRGNYCLQVVLEDHMGDIYASDLVPLEKEGASKSVSVEAGGDTMFFSLREDYAVLTGYQGQGEKLEVPEEVEGRPVTAIASGAVKMAENLLEIALPSSLERIGDRAFEGCIGLTEVIVPEGCTHLERGAFAMCTSLERCVLPASLEFVGEAVFAGDKALSRIEGAEQGTGYCLQDGVLYTGDGEILLACPGARTGCLMIPEGTKKIGHGACWGSALESVAFPDSLEEIDNHAFFNCRNLAVPVFPEGLTRIMNAAFGASADSISLRDVPEEPVQIHLPATVQEIGRDAFGGFPIRTFTVEDGNPTYRCIGGHLTNLAGDAIVQAEVLSTNALEIPDGIVSLDEYLLDVFDPLIYYEFYYIGTYEDYAEDLRSLDHHLNIYIPESVQYISEELSVSYELSPVFHSGPLSPARDYAARHGFDWSNDAEDPEEAERRESVIRGSLSSYKDSEYEVSPYLSYVEPGAFSSARELKAFVSTGKNEHFCVKEGLLYSADGTELIACPRKYGERVEIPEGTRVIGKMAFDGNTELREVVIPDSVVEIDGNAFYDCSGLENIVFGSGLKTIRGSAFSGTGITALELPEGVRTIGRFAFSFCKKLKNVRLPASLETIDWTSFQQDPARIEIAEDNPFFRSAEGFVTDGTGHVLVYCPEGLGKDGKLRIPEGITVIDSSAVKDGCWTDVWFPASVEYISIYGLGSKNKVVLHAPKGSFAAEYCRENAPYSDWSWVEE